MSEIPLAFVVRDNSRRGVASFDSNMRRARRSAGSTEKSFGSLNNTTTRLGGAFQALGAALSVRSVSRYADTWIRLTNQLKVVEKTSLGVAKAQGKLFKTAQDTRQSLEGTVALYTRMKRAQDRLGISGTELNTIVTAVNQGIAVSGATTKEAEAGLIQLSQAFQSGKLAGDELRSVMENLPILAQAIADGLGIPFDEFRDKAKDLTSGELAKGILNSAGNLAEAFKRTNSTIGQSFQTLENAVVKFTGELDISLGVSLEFTEIMGKLSRNLDKVATALLGIGGAIAALAASKGLTMLIRLFASIGGGGTLGILAKLGSVLTAGFGAKAAIGFGDRSQITRTVKDRDYLKDGSFNNPDNLRRVDVTRGDEIKAFMSQLNTIPKRLSNIVSGTLDGITAIFEHVLKSAEVLGDILAGMFTSPFETNEKLRNGGFADELTESADKIDKAFELVTSQFGGFARDVKARALNLAVEREINESNKLNVGDNFSIGNMTWIHRLKADLADLWKFLGENLGGIGSLFVAFSTAVSGLSPKLDKVLKGITDTASAFAQGGPILAAATGFNALLSVLGHSQTEAERAAERQREFTSSMIEAAEASIQASNAVKQFSASILGYTENELTRFAEVGETLQAIINVKSNSRGASGLDSITADGLFGDSLGAAGLYETQANRSRVRPNPSSSPGGAGARNFDKIDFTIVDDFLGQFDDSADYAKKVGELIAVFGDLDTEAGIRSAIDRMNIAKDNLVNFGSILTDTFAGASEAFRHNKSLSRPIGQALIDLFTESFEQIASFDSATGAVTALTDLSIREINSLEEQFVDVRLEAARVAGKRLADGFASNEERLTALRFQKESIAARANLSKSFDQAGGDTFLQKQALGEFQTAMTAIKNSLILARSRPDGTSSTTGGSGGNGNSTTSTHSSKIAIGAGDAVAIDTYDSIIKLPDTPLAIEWSSVLSFTEKKISHWREVVDIESMFRATTIKREWGDVLHLARRRITHWWDVVETSSLDNAVKVKRWWSDAVHLRRIEVTHWWNIIETSSLGSAAKIRRWWSDAIHLKRIEITHWWSVIETSSLSTAMKIQRSWSDAIKLTAYAVSGWAAVVDTSALSGASKVKKKWSDIFSFTRSSSMQSYLGEQVSDPTGWSAIIQLGSLSKHSKKWSDAVEFSRDKAHANYLKNPEDGDKSGWSSIIQFPNLSKHSRPFSDVIEFTRSNLNIGDMLGVSGRVNIGNLIDLQVDGFDFFFKIADKADEIRGAIENTFKIWPEGLKASVSLTDLISIDASGFKEAVVMAVEEAAGDRQTGITVSRSYGSGYAG
jgi:tape measure domain-containing protein